MNELLDSMCSEIEAATGNRSPTTTRSGELYTFLVKWISSATEAVESPDEGAAVALSKSPRDPPAFLPFLPKKTSTQGSGVGSKHRKGEHSELIVPPA